MKQQLFLAFGFFLSAYGLDPVVRIKQGLLHGYTLKSRGGRDFLAFSGIPYAEPPIGKLRFKELVPGEAWNGERNATVEGSDCTQINIFSNQFPQPLYGQEDCLYANVYTPSISNSARTKLPVLVVIHGGGYRGGSGTKQVLGPQFLLDKNIVVVTFNYRIGPLGFLSTEDSTLPGNLGLKDQVVALQWIQDNIAAFGGNPGAVTIMGDSAGGSSVHYLMLSPLSKGLFRHAISQSGVSLNPWAHTKPGVARKLAQELSAIVGCPVLTSTQMVECLSTKTAEELVQGQQKMKDWAQFAFLLRPVVEPAGTKGAYLTADPWTLNTTTAVPWFVGITAQEGAFFFARELASNASENVAQLKATFDSWAPKYLSYKETATNPQSITDKVKTFYLYGTDITEANILPMIDMITDNCFAYGVVESLKRHNGPIYFYLYDYKGTFSWTTVFGAKQNLGVCHGDDMIHLFSSPAIHQWNKATEQDKRISESLIDFVANFTASGVPSSQSSNVVWEDMKKDEKFLHISNKGYKMEKDFLKPRMAFWAQLYSKHQIH